MTPLSSIPLSASLAQPWAVQPPAWRIAAPPVTYRLIRPEEEAAAMDLWAAEFTWIARPRLEAEYRLGDPRRLAHTHVAVDPHGHLLAAVTYCLRTMRDTNGVPHRVGCLVNVVTHPAARRQGHAHRLLTRAVAAMRSEGCAWALLYTTEQGRPLYACEGWRAFPQRFVQGLVQEHHPVQAPYIVRPFDPARTRGGWVLLAHLYEAYNNQRPLSMVRDAAYWQGYAALRFAGWPKRHRALVLIAAPAAGGAPCGYVLAYIATPAEARKSYGQPAGITVAEVALQPGHDGALPALLQGVTSAAGPGPCAARMHLPATPAVEDAVQELFGGTLTPCVDTRPLALSLRPADEDPTLDTLFHAPGALLWPVDEL